MEYILNNKEMALADKNMTIFRGVPSISLMEKAGYECYKKIKEVVNKDSYILIVPGQGGNGGDGLVIARYLYEDNYNVNVYLTGQNLKSDTKENLNRYKGNIITSLEINEKDLVIIDAYLGVGVNTSLKEEAINLINKINSLNAKVISIDINSGINGDNGLPLGAYIKSDLTIAINNFKLGHFLNFGLNAYNSLTKIDANIIVEESKNYAKLAYFDDFKHLFKKRMRVSNKGTYGRVALIGGSKETPGAINLSLNALAALRGGVGYASVCIPKSLYPYYALKNDENIYKLLSDDDGHYVFNENDILSLLNYDAISIGVGIGTSIEVYKLISYLFKNYSGNLLIDADGLNSIAKFGVDILKEHQCNVILTPHLKEFSRLINLPISEIRLDILNYVKSFAKKYNIFINVKDATSIISDGEEVYINIKGNAGLAKGGSGDVLNGITLSLLTKKEDILLKVALGAFILGSSSEEAIKEINEYSLLANDLSKYLIQVFNKFLE